jgi:hypothetical protein
MRSTISACVALCAVALCGGISKVALADNAAGTGVKACDIMLNHMTPGDVIKLLHWNDPKMRPAGVTSITGNTADNSLHVVATKEGLAQVEDLVSAVDVPVRQILVNIAEVLVPRTQVDRFGIAGNGVTRTLKGNSDFLYEASGKLVAQMLADFTVRGYVVGTPSITTTNNVAATLTMTNSKATKELVEVNSLTIMVSPRANSDNTVTLPLKIAMGSGAQEQLFMVTRTVRDKESLVAAYGTPAAVTLKDKLLLIFVTPHILELK